MADLRVIEGGKNYPIAEVTSLEIGGEELPVGTLVPLNPEQWFKLWRTGRDGENLDIHEAQLTAAATLKTAREKTLHAIQGGQ